MRLTVRQPAAFFVKAQEGGALFGAQISVRLCVEYLIDDRAQVSAETVRVRLRLADLAKPLHSARTASTGAHAGRGRRVLPWLMGNDRRPGAAAARSIISLGHVLAGGAALVFAGVMIVAGAAPNAELGGVLLPLGLLLALIATVFTYTAFMFLRRAPQDRRGPSLILSIVELLAGAVTAAAVVVAVQSYGAFEPWRSPLLLPSALLLALGLAGVGLEASRRATTPEMH